MSGFSTDRISVILCTRNRKDDLMRCLQTLHTQTLPAHEIIIVDSSDMPIGPAPFDTFTNVNTQGERGTARGEQSRIHTSGVIYLHTQPGLTYQRNRGIQAATGDIIFFFDDDVTLEPDYLKTMRNTFIKHPTYAGGMGAVTNIKPYHFNMYRIFRFLFLLDRNHDSGKFTLSGMPTHAYGNSQFQQIQVLGGCCMAFRTWALHEQKFDEQLRFYGYMEDCDISQRLSRKYPLFYQPAARLAHHESPVNRDKLFHNRAMFIANYSYLFFKNFYPHARWQALFYCWTVLGLLLEGVLRADRQVFFGYLHGLKHVYITRARLPYYPQKSPQNTPHTQPRSL